MFPTHFIKYKFGRHKTLAEKEEFYSGDRIPGIIRKCGVDTNYKNIEPKTEYFKSYQEAYKRYQTLVEMGYLMVYIFDMEKKPIVMFHDFSKIGEL